MPSLVTEPSRVRSLRRRVRPRDRDAVRRLLTDSGFFSMDEIEVAVELIDETLADPSSGDYHFLFFDSDDGELAGYACFGPISLTESSWDLYWIAVDPVRKRSGIGKLLLKKVEESVAGFGGRRLFVDTSGRPQYAPTRSFYEGVGYSRVAELEGFYGEGDSKVIYGRRLDPRLDQARDDSATTM